MQLAPVTLQGRGAAPTTPPSTVHSLSGADAVKVALTVRFRSYTLITDSAISFTNGHCLAVTRARAARLAEFNFTWSPQEGAIRFIQRPPAGAGRPAKFHLGAVVMAAFTGQSKFIT